MNELEKVMEKKFFCPTKFAQEIESLVLHNNDMNYIDGPVSITQKQMTEMVQEIRRIECIFGDGRVNMSSAQEGTKQFRRYS